jgi:hypothetical protein
MPTNDLRRIFVPSSLLLAIAIQPLTALATCGDGNEPSYDDILAVQFQRQGCSGLTHAPPTRFSCSAYSVYISNWNRRQHQVAEYSQFTFPGAIGHFRLNITGADIIAILRQHDFFHLNPPNIALTDVGYSILTVKHCDVVTRLSLPGAFGEDEYRSKSQATLELFSAIDTFVQNAPKEQLSSEPSRVDYNWDGIY